ncbi:hypothetical protein, partial [Rhodoblastus sp.]|uniref:hypothetical protein n=1 Tax=Rhodoblastus sp. TaxID=1962975 RepID=UPI0035B1CD29
MIALDRNAPSRNDAGLLAENPKPARVAGHGQGHCAAAARSVAIRPWNASRDIRELPIPSPMMAVRTQSARPRGRVSGWPSPSERALARRHSPAIAGKAANNGPRHEVDPPGDERRDGVVESGLAADSQ